MTKMTYRERHQVASLIADNRHIEADKSLLAKYDSKHSLLHRSLESAQGSTLSFDLTFTLLDHVTVAEIQSNRSEWKKKSAKKGKAVKQEAPAVRKETAAPSEEPKETAASEEQETTARQESSEDISGQQDGHEDTNAAETTESVQKKS